MLNINISVFLFCISTLFTFDTQAQVTVPELTVNKLTDNVYLYKSYHHTESWGVVSSNGLILIKDHQAIIFDTPWSERDTKNLFNWLKDKNYQLIASISTHSHDDRTAGIAWLNKHNIATYASKRTNDLLAKQGKIQASHVIEEDVLSFVNGVFSIGDVEVFYPGAGHTIDNIVIWLPKQHILYGGCFLRSLNAKGLGYTGEADIKAWATSASKVLNRYSQAEIVIPGHGKIGDIALIHHTKKLTEETFNRNIK